jgi:hypothetical protein
MLSFARCLFALLRFRRMLPMVRFTRSLFALTCYLRGQGNASDVQFHQVFICTNLVILWADL